MEAVVVDTPSAAEGIRQAGRREDNQRLGSYRQQEGDRDTRQRVDKRQLDMAQVRGTHQQGDTPRRVDTHHTASQPSVAGQDTATSSTAFLPPQRRSRRCQLISDKQQCTRPSFAIFQAEPLFRNCIYFQCLIAFPTHSTIALLHNGPWLSEAQSENTEYQRGVNQIVQGMHKQYKQDMTDYD